VTTIGYATLQIIPSLKGVSDEINKQLAAMPDVGKTAGKKIGDNIAAGVLTSSPGKKIGKDLESGVGDGAKGAEREVRGRLSERLGAEVGAVVGRGVGGALKGAMTTAAKAGELALKGSLVGAAGVASIAVGGIGLALTKGFDRLKSIDAAKSKLVGLGNSAADVSKIMDSALKSVQGTAFGLDAAATAAASAVAAGIKPGQDLTKYLKDVGDAAAIAGTSFEDMGSIFNKIQTSNKAYTDDLNQLSDRGLPIFTWLQKEYGVTGDKLSEMVQKGEVDSAHFRHAIETNIGGAALKMGDSFQGSVDNAEAALGRLGAALLKPLFVNAAGGIGSITTGLDSMTKWVNEHQPEIIDFFKNVGVAAVSLAQDVVRSFGSMLQGVGDFTHALGTLSDAFGIDNNLKSVGDTISGIGDKLVTTADGFDAAKDKIRAWGETAKAAAEKALLIEKIPGYKLVTVALGGDAAEKIPGLKLALDGLHDKKVNVIATVNGQVTSPPGTVVPTFDGVPDPTQIGPAAGLFGDSASNGGSTALQKRYGHATGGSIFGPGSGTSDSIPAMLSNGEHVWTADEVNKLGGQSAMYRLRGMVKSGLLKGFDSGGAVNPNPLLNILLGRGGQRDNWAEYGTYDPMQHMMMKRNMVGVDPSGLRTPGGGIFNGAMAIDTSNVSVSPAPKWGYDQWRLTFDDFADATTYQKGERDNPSFYKKQAQLKNDPLGGWLLGYAGGGAVGGSPINVDAFKRFASGISGGRYIRGGPPGLSGTDCSGAQSALANFLTGGSGRFATGSEGPALSSRGFQMGDPPPGITAYWIGWRNGGPGGGHTAGTIIDPKGGNVNVEMGGASGGGGYGGRAGGASGFSNRAWIALAGAIADGVTEDPRTPTDFSAGTPTSGPSSSGGGGFTVPSSLSGLSGFGLSGLGKGIGTTKSGSDLSVFGNAAASAVSGQVSSALGVFGAGDNPPFLQAASQLLGGISIGGHGSAAPLSASGSGTGTLPPDGVHGSRAGQAPGPVFNTNISAFDTTDALRMWDNKKNQLLAAQTTAY
jgi:tape measure domain-containing protein